ncbi:MAG: hypothetical protein DGJ47_000019 [Rickettsiaceae bacterium]
MSNQTLVKPQNKEIESSFLDYIALMKPRVMSLVVFTALCGMLLAPGEIHFLIAFEAILLVALGAGSAAAINMWYDRDIDAIMLRTQNRPIIKGVIIADEALSFGIVTGILSVILLGLFANIISAILLAITILYYVFIYTMWLKRSSIYNIVIGGASGALPPVIGWTIVTGEITIEPILLFMIIFIWTPPHSWALALFKSDDYKKCNVPMMPVIKGDIYTKKQMLFYSIIMALVVALPYFINMVSLSYLYISSLLSAGFIYLCIKLFSDLDNKYAKKLFWYSIFYLFTIFLLLVIFNQI